MKKIILFGILTVLLVGIASSQLQAKPTIDKTITIKELNTTILNKESTDKIASFYSSRVKEKPISYITDGKIVIINFKNTNKRIITKKERFDNLIVNNPINNK